MFALPSDIAEVAVGQWWPGGPFVGQAAVAAGFSFQSGLLSPSRVFKLPKSGTNWPTLRVRLRQYLICYLWTGVNLISRFLYDRIPINNRNGAGRKCARLRAASRATPSRTSQPTASGSTEHSTNSNRCGRTFPFISFLVIGRFVGFEFLRVTVAIC